jgi:hypothetical protein
MADLFGFHWGIKSRHIIIYELYNIPQYNNKTEPNYCDRLGQSAVGMQQRAGGKQATYRAGGMDRGQAAECRGQAADKRHRAGGMHRGLAAEGRRQRGDIDQAAWTEGRQQSAEHRRQRGDIGQAAWKGGRGQRAGSRVQRTGGRQAT